jgi:hypothetical protein
MITINSRRSINRPIPMKVKATPKKVYKVRTGVEIRTVDPKIKFDFALGDNFSNLSFIRPMFDLSVFINFILP